MHNAINEKDLISKEGLLKDLAYCAPELFTDKEYLINRIEKQHIIDARPVVHGHWIEDRTEIVCSVCGARYRDEMFFMPVTKSLQDSYKYLRYCPCCAADLDSKMDNFEVNCK